MCSQIEAINTQWLTNINIIKLNKIFTFAKILNYRN